MITPVLTNFRLPQQFVYFSLMLSFLRIEKVFDAVV